MHSSNSALRALGPKRPRLVPAPASAPKASAIGYASVRGLTDVRHPDLTRQALAIHLFCARREWEVVQILWDVKPRGRRAPGRPGLGHAIDRLRRGEASCLVVAELERLCPSIAELGEILDAIQQANARLVSLDPALDTGTTPGRVAAQALMSVSSWERARRLEATSAARAKAPVLPMIKPELRRWIVQMRASGMTLQAIADLLNDDGVPTVRGGVEWRTSSVQAALGYKRPGRSALGRQRTKHRRPKEAR